MPQSREIEFYDKENYANLERLTGGNIADLTKFIKVRPELYNDGYKAVIILKPNVLGFIEKSGLQSILFLIDIIDVDEKRIQETVLSSSKSRKWGEPNSFNKIKLNKKLTVNLDKNLKSLGNSENLDQADQKIRNTFPNIFWFTEKGWKPVSRFLDEFYCYDQPYVFELPKIQKCSFKQSDI